MTLVLRPARLTDLESIHQLAIESGVGLTTLSKNSDTLKERVSLSVDSFNKIVTSPSREYYLFVLENSVTQEIVGTSAIKASLGHTTPSYTYKVINRTRISHDIGVRCDQTWLMLVNDFHQKSELCTLYLRPDNRHSNYGVFLSRARFLYMAEHPSRFESSVIAELRGVTDGKGHSPFWNSVGQHFFQIPFEEADALTTSTNKQFIADLIPEHPIPVQLLDKKAQDVIGIPHPSTEPAMRILLSEGFRYVNSVDIFDAGPIIEATCADIRTIRSSSKVTIVDVVDKLDSPRFIVSTADTHFRATIGSVLINDNGAVVTKQLADLLKVNQGDMIRVTGI